MIFQLPTALVVKLRQSREKYFPPGSSYLQSSSLINFSNLSFPRCSWGSCLARKYGNMSVISLHLFSHVQLWWFWCSPASAAHSSRSARPLNTCWWTYCSFGGFSCVVAGMPPFQVMEKVCCAFRPGWHQPTTYFADCHRLYPNHFQIIDVV